MRKSGDIEMIFQNSDRKAQFRFKEKKDSRKEELKQAIEHYKVREWIISQLPM